MKKLSIEQKQVKCGGAFYSVALGIGILVSTISTLVSNIICSAKAGNTSQELYGSTRRSTMLRLSPVPSRSSIMVI